MGNTFCKTDVIEQSPSKLEAGQLIQEIIPVCDKFTKIDIASYNDKYNLIKTRANILIAECNQKPDKYYESIKNINELLFKLSDCLQISFYKNYDDFYNELSIKLDEFRTELDKAEPENTYIYQFVDVANGQQKSYYIKLLMIDEYRSVVKVVVDNKKYISRIRHSVCYTNPTMSNLVITETVNNLIKSNLDTRTNVKFEKKDDTIFIIMNNSISNVNTKFEYTIKCYSE